MVTEMIMGACHDTGSCAKPTVKGRADGGMWKKLSASSFVEPKR